MKAEIGFVRDWTGDMNRTGYGALTERLQLVVTSQSESEYTLLSVFAKRMGRTIDESSGCLTIEEPAK